ncbi:MAG: hypothetical protein M3Z24_07455, partial [Chloroflexota bacterium]|nr:hypothetical protein [Chloroflexota bacterium]
MANKSISVEKPKSSGIGKIVGWALGVGCFAVLGLMLARMALQFLSPAPPAALQLVQDIPLPSVFNNVNANDPLLPGAGVRFDHFDFQTIDPQTHLLFMVHTGPNPTRFADDPKFDVKNDGNILVFDTRQNKVVKRIDIPQTSGIVAAPDLGLVYAAGNGADTIYEIDERTFNFTEIKLPPNSGPDALDYDPVDHKIFASAPGRPTDLAKNPNIDPRNQTVTVIDTATHSVTRIPMGTDGKFGDDVGHIHYDAVSHRVFVVIQPLFDQNDPNGAFAPPSFLTAIDPVSNRVTARVRLPDECVAPHGMMIDGPQQEAFVACLDSVNLARVDLKTMKSFPDLQPLPVKADIVTLDQSAHILYVGAGGGLALFDESNHSLVRKATFNYGVSTHTVAVNQETHQVYLPIPILGGRPVLRIEQY